MFLCLLILIMDVAAGILGFEAEIAQNKVCLIEAGSILSSALIQEMCTQTRQL